MGLSLDGKDFPGSTIDGVTSGEAHKLVVSVPGFADQTFGFTGSPYEKKHFDVAIDRASNDVPTSTTSAPVATHHSWSHSSPQPAATSQSGGGGGGGTGKLNVGASGGWCNVTVDGVARGATPVAGIELGAGTHRVGCVGPDGKSQATMVSVSADSTTRYRFTMAQ
jgi:hypothetical protein